jgi:hypothetical protein
MEIGRRLMRQGRGQIRSVIIRRKSRVAGQTSCGSGFSDCVAIVVAAMGKNCVTSCFEPHVVVKDCVESPIVEADCVECHAS